MSKKRKLKSEPWRREHRLALVDIVVSIVIGVLSIIIGVLSINSPFIQLNSAPDEDGTTNPPVETVYPQYAYELSSHWSSIDSRLAELDLQTSFGLVTSKTDVYHRLATLNIIYHNLDKQDRIIDRIIVDATDIVEDYSPRLNYNSPWDIDAAIFWVTNTGWGETGAFTVSFSGFRPSEGTPTVPAVDLSLKDDVQTVWEFESIRPGEECDLVLTPKDDIIVDRKGDIETDLSYDMVFSLEAPEKEFRCDLILKIYIHSDRFILSGLGGGAYPPTRGVVIDTWSSTYHEEIELDPDYCIKLPGEEAVMIPITVLPQKSCKMSVSIRLETLDGEIIDTEPLVNTRFIVPYYTKTDIFEYLESTESVKSYEMIHIPPQILQQIFPDS